MRIVLLRHGEVENPNKIIYGRLTGYPLTKNGRDQIKIITQKIKREKLNKPIIYASPLLRTVESAQIIADQLNIKLIKKDRQIIERNEGNYQGLTNHQIFQSKIIPQKRETVDRCRKRALNFLKHISKSNNDAIVVTHGIIVQCLVSESPDKEFDKLLSPFAGYYLINYCDGKISLIYNKPKTPRPLWCDLK